MTAPGILPPLSLSTLLLPVQRNTQWEETKI